MIAYFGGQLRRELVELMGRSLVIRRRKDSTGSHRLSADIIGLDEEHMNFSQTVDLATGVGSEGGPNAGHA